MIHIAQQYRRRFQFFFILFSEEHIQSKWANVRDAFVRSLKTKTGRPKRKYILYDHLKFLTKVVPEDEGVDYVEDFTIPSSYIIEEIVEKKAKKRTKKEESDDDYSANEDYCIRKRSRKQEYTEETPSKSRDQTDTEFVAVDETQNSRIMNEDEAFFASLLPSVVKYSEDERLEFRIEVLGVMKRIKESRKWNKSNSIAGD